MKITNIQLYSNNKNVATFSFRDPSAKNPYIAQGVFGLDADEIIPKYYGLSTGGVDKYYDMSVKSREVVIRIALNPQFSDGKSYSDLRDDLYRVISSSRTGKVQLRLNNGLSNVAVLYGFVTKFETPLFNQLPEVQITIKCDDPMLKALEPVYVNHFLIGTADTIVDDKSTASHGFNFDLTFNADSLSFVIRDSATPTWTFTVTPGLISGLTGFKTNDKLYFSSDFKDRQLYIVRSSVVIKIIDKIQPGSVWPIMFPGENDFQFVSGNFTWDSFSYYPTYWGV